MAPRFTVHDRAYGRDDRWFDRPSILDACSGSLRPASRRTLDEHVRRLGVDPVAHAALVDRAFAELPFDPAEEYYATAARGVRAAVAPRFQMRDPVRTHLEDRRSPAAAPRANAMQID